MFLSHNNHISHQNTERNTFALYPSFFWETKEFCQLTLQYRIIIFFLMFALHFSCDIFNHLFIETQFGTFDVEILDFSISANVSINTSSHVRADQLFTRIDVQRLQKPRMVLQHVFLMITATKAKM